MKVWNNTYLAYVAENMKGNLQYADFLDEYDQGSYMEKYVYAPYRLRILR
jgi:hypothetical protein